MSALDRLANYSAKQPNNQTKPNNTEDTVFDVTTPEGAFFDRVHNKGYDMYEKDEQGNIKYSELHDCISTVGNQLVNAIAGSGKALRNGTKVMTETGYRPIEALKVGDKVYGRDGYTHTVTGVFPQGLCADTYEVEFLSGRKIYCNGSHIWSVIIADGNIKNVTTEELIDKAGKEYIILPSVKELHFYKKDETDKYADSYLRPVRQPLMPIHPYLIGLFMSNTRVRVIDYAKSSAFRFLEVDLTTGVLLSKYVKKLHTDLEQIVIKDNYAYLYMTEKFWSNFNHYINKGVISTENGYVQMNCIPKDYLFSSLYVRHSIVRGIYDFKYKFTSNIKGLSWHTYEDIKYLANYDVNIKTNQLREDLTFLLETLGFVVSKIKLSQDCREWSAIKDSNNVIMGITKLSKPSEMTCIAIDSPDHLYLTEHCIPTHNTTALSLKLIHDIVTGEVTDVKTLANGMQYRVIDKVWVCTFLRSGAEELKESLLGWQRELGYSQTADQITISTLDAEFKRCLEAMGIKAQIGEASKLATLLRRAIMSCNITRSGYPLNKEDYQILSSVVTYCRGRLDNKKFDHPSMKDYDITPTIMEMIIEQYATLRRAEGIMDFEEITELLYKFLYVTPNKNVQDFVSNRFNHIYIDEFQDTSQIQYAILKFYARGKLWLNRDGEEHNTDVLYTGSDSKGKIVAVGDVSQCIYSFKGSDIDIIAHQFDKDFVPTFSTLSYNWRCPEEILEPIVPSIHKNTDSKVQKILTKKKGGKFEVVKFRNLKQMSDKLLVDLEQDIQKNYKVGILVRTNFDGVIPALLLENSSKFNFSISGENMTLKSQLPSRLVSVSSIFMSGWSNEVRQTMDILLGKIAPYEIDALMKTCANNTTNMFKLSEEDLQYSTPHLAPLILQLKEIIFVNGKRDKRQEVEGLKYLYWYLYTKVYANNYAYSINARAYIEALLNMIDTKKYASVYDFREDCDFLSDKLTARVKKNKAQIQIMTVHEAKGKEWDSVYIWNDSEGVFPSSKCNINNKAELEEERRVHYIACTRAKESERIYTLEGKEGMFLEEMDYTGTIYIPKIVQKV